MKQLLLISLFLFCCFLVKAQNNCAALKTGTFTYTNDSSEAILVKRHGKRQEEINKAKDIITKFKIKWVSDCSYEIKQVWSNSKKQRKQNGATTTVVITKATRDGYEYTCACKDEKQREKSKGIVYRVLR